MNRIMKFLRKPGAKGEIKGVAPTQKVTTDEDNVENIKTYITKRKARMLDRWLDVVVASSGSDFVFFSILSGLLTWALLGIRYGTSTTWQVLISDVQAIISYMFDSLLVRQQLNGYDDAMLAVAQMRSRILSHCRMFKQVSSGPEKREAVHSMLEHETVDNISEFEADLPQENRFGHLVTMFSMGLGHIITIFFFWVGVIAWLGIGNKYAWSNMWQLYMNSASSALMVFTFSFLANIRERHATYSKLCLDAIFTVDSALETKLRSLTGDTLSNDVVIIAAPKVNKIQRAIFYYADLVGTLIGVFLLTLVMVAWVAIGPALQFDSNWWLLIGTYAGLVGMNDGFVLRNMQARLGSYVQTEFDKLDEEDEKLFAIIGLPIPVKETCDDNSLSYHVSNFMTRVAAHEITVITGVLIIIGLIIGASVMRWNFTGQLLCNVPPSIIESFFMIMLITGHNADDRQKRVDLKNIYDRRLRLLSLVTRIEFLKDKAFTPREKKEVDTAFLCSVSREVDSDQ